MEPSGVFISSEKKTKANLSRFIVLLREKCSDNMHDEGAVGITASGAWEMRPDHIHRKATDLGDARSRFILENQPGQRIYWNCEALRIEPMHCSFRRTNMAQFGPSGALGSRGLG
jgi:hypothetical protein